MYPFNCTSTFGICRQVTNSKEWSVSSSPDPYSNNSLEIIPICYYYIYYNIKEVCLSVCVCVRPSVWYEIKAAEGIYKGKKFWKQPLFCMFIKLWTMKHNLKLSKLHNLKKPEKKIENFKRSNGCESIACAINTYNRTVRIDSMPFPNPH